MDQSPQLSQLSMDAQSLRTWSSSTFRPMRFTPIVGSNRIPFGASYEDVVRTFGSPDSDESQADIESYPKGRRILKYAEFSLAIGSEIGLFGMGLRLDLGPVFLWDTMINDLTMLEFRDLLASHGASFASKDSSWDIFSADHGILAYFSEDTIYQLDLTIPYSCPSNY